MADTCETYDVTLTHVHAVVLVQWGTQRLSSRVALGESLAIVRDAKTKNEFHVRAPHHGTLIARGDLCEGERYETAEPLFVARLALCTHSVVYRGRCVHCMTDIDASNDVRDAKIWASSMCAPGASGHVRMSHATAERLIDSVAMAEAHRHAQRLHLVCDLDQTLVSSTEVARDAPVPPHVDEVIPATSSRTVYHTCIRPGVRAILAALAQHAYTLHVYTSGTRSYAQRIVQLLDPSGALFGTRIVARERGCVAAPDAADGEQKSLTRLLPYSYALAIVLDDRVSIWGEHADRVLRVRAYHAFATDGVSARDLVCSREARQDDAQHLRAIYQSLMAIWKRFYARDAPALVDARLALYALRRSVLDGVCIVFTGMVALDKDVMQSHMAQHAMLFGAEILVDMDVQRCTHVVARKADTRKVYEARRHARIYVVSERWLHDSINRWRRQPEAPYTLTFHRKRVAAQNDDDASVICKRARRHS